MRELTGSEPSDAYEWEAAAKALVQEGQVTVVALTTGYLGAAPVTRNQGLACATTLHSAAKRGRRWREFSGSVGLAAPFGS